MSDHDEAQALPDAGPAAAQLADAEKLIADTIEEAIGTPGSIEEEQMLEAAELLEVELPDD